MKSSIKVLVISGLAGFVLWGCGGSSSDDNNTTGEVCTATGCYATGTGITGYGTLPPNAVVLAPQTQISITNSSQYDAFLRSIGACDSLINSCSGYDASPLVQIELDDYTFPNNTTTTGNITITVAAGSFNSVVTWREVNNYGSAGGGFAAGIQTSPSITGWGSVSGTGGLLQVIVTGLSTDSSVSVELTYNNVPLGTGVLYRAN